MLQSVTLSTGKMYFALTPDAVLDFTMLVMPRNPEPSDAYTAGVMCVDQDGSGKSFAFYTLAQFRAQSYFEESAGVKLNSKELRDEMDRHLTERERDYFHTNGYASHLYVDRIGSIYC